MIRQTGVHMVGNRCRNDRPPELMIPTLLITWFNLEVITSRQHGVATGMS